MMEEEADQARPEYDPACYLCPGNVRANGQRNPDYDGVYVFPNDFPALLPDAEAAEGCSEGLFRAVPVRGECRVICFSPRHDLTLASMPAHDIEKVVDLWIQQVGELSERYRWVQVFENKGAAMGCSNPHPHGQIWAGDFLPSLPAREDATQRSYLAKHGRRLLADVAEEEAADGRRVVCENEAWLWLVPFWAIWPYEALLLPKLPASRLTELEAEERRLLAEILKDGLGRFDRLFSTSFPYSMGWHGAPGREPDDAWVVHAHFYPPLLRSATVRKFMVGYEMLAEPQRDLTPERAAATLRGLG
jgi:UDPglucose--hexose-1-phosphate uridylyltransferase